jgi:hypothetical protein
LVEVIDLLVKIILLLSRARVTMRMDLGVIDKPPWMTCDSARRMSGHVEP